MSVKFVGQAIDDGHPRMGGKALQPRLFKGADHHHIDHARNDPCGVLDGFSAAQLRIARGQVDDRTAHLVHPRLERHAGAGAGFLEHHRQRAVVQRVVRLVAFELVLDEAGAAQDVVHLGGGEIAELQKMPNRAGGWATDWATDWTVKRGKWVHDQGFGSVANLPSYTIRPRACPPPRIL